jgi:hypothetical protein
VRILIDLDQDAQESEVRILIDLAQAALLGATAYVLCRAWASLMVRLADSGCTCARHAWDPCCPVHGRRESA